MVSPIPKQDCMQGLTHNALFCSWCYRVPCGHSWHQESHIVTKYLAQKVVASARTLRSFNKVLVYSTIQYIQLNRELVVDLNHTEILWSDLKRTICKHKTWKKSAWCAVHEGNIQDPFQCCYSFHMFKLKMSLGSCIIKFLLIAMKPIVLD